MEKFKNHWKMIILVNNQFMCVDSTVSLGFFDDIIIPPESLQQPAKLYPELPLLKLI